MFDEFLRELESLEQGVEIPVRIKVDDKGYLDRLCPSEECQAEFKVQFDDWRQKVRDEAVYCPLCRHEAPSTEWNTSAQLAHYEEAALAHLGQVIDQALDRDSRNFNAHQPRGGLITMSMSYQPEPTPILVPPEAAEAMRQQVACEACGCRYSSVGAAFFCPSCGHNSAASTFTAAVQAVRTSVTNIQKIKDAVKAAADDDAATDTARQILENGLVKLVASFQRFAEATFQALLNASSFKVRKNLFQNLSESTLLWRNATGKGYEDFLTLSEMTELSFFFQQRHILAHREGIVDQDYLDKSGDRSYSVGQRLVIRDQAVLRLAEIVEKLGMNLPQSLPTTATGVKKP